MKLVKVLLVIAMTLSSASSYAALGEMPWHKAAGVATDCERDHSKDYAIAKERNDSQQRPGSSAVKATRALSQNSN